MPATLGKAHDMKAIIFGATGMVGSGVLIECLADPRVEAVLVVGRSRCHVDHPKLRELIHTDFFDYTTIAPELAGYDACFFCLGVSSAGMGEAAYQHVTYDLTLAAARTLAKGNTGMTFCYVSGQGTDSTEHGRSMWARVKGRTENALLRLPLNAFMFRPGIIQPLKGVRSRTRLYQLFYTLTGPFFPVLRRLLPSQVTTSVNVGRAMIRVAVDGYGKRILEVRDINALANPA